MFLSVSVFPLEKQLRLDPGQGGKRSQKETFSDVLILTLQMIFISSEVEQSLQDKFIAIVRRALEGQQLKDGIPALLTCALGNPGEQMRLSTGPDSSASGMDTWNGITMQPQRIAGAQREYK